MQGYRVVFSTIRGRKHDGKEICEWLIQKAKELQIDGVTLIDAQLGYGRDKNVHSAHFFELADQPVEVIMLADEQKCDKLFEAIKSANLSIFYAKTHSEFGFTC